ncbi:MAG: DNA primase [Caldilineaceae bacterium]
MSVSDEVKQRIDIVDLISRYTPLKRSGATYKGLCPFHNERTPSFIVFPHTQTWHCFGACGDGGDIFRFVMRKENLDFREALQMLAKEAGVNLEENLGDPFADQRAKLYELNELATTYFQEILRHHPAAQKARDYLQRRGIDAATQTLFRLGYALEQWSALRDFLSEKGYNVDQQLLAGLLKHNEERNSTYDAFRARLMIPIRDRQGRVIGFGGRVLDDSQPKYLNTSDTTLFHKSRIIYGLDLAHQAIRAANKVVIVEGYMDVIAAHQYGYANVVACMGTALTTDQLQQLQRYTDNFVLALDADVAGQQATLRGLNQARQALAKVTKPTITASGRVELTERLGANLYITAMPQGLDPDDVIRHNPPEWQTFVAKAQPLVDFYFKIVADQYDLTSARGKGQAVAELTPLIAELNEETERQHYVQKLSKLVQIAELIIDSRVKSSARTQHVALVQKERKGAQRVAKPDEQRTPGPNAPVRSLERPDPQAASAPANPLNEEDYLLARMLGEPDLVVWLVGATNTLEIQPVKGNDFQNVENQEIFRALKQYMSSDEQWDLELFQDSLTTPHLHGRLGQLLAYHAQLPQSSENTLREDVIRTLIRIRIQRLSGECTNIKFLQEDAAHQGDLEGAKQLGDINNQHLRDLFHLQQSRQQLSQALFRSDRRERGVKIF